MCLVLIFDRNLKFYDFVHLLQFLQNVLSSLLISWNIRNCLKNSLCLYSHPKHSCFKKCKFQLRLAAVYFNRKRQITILLATCLSHWNVLLNYRTKFWCSTHRKVLNSLPIVLTVSEPTYKQHGRLVLWGSWRQSIGSPGSSSVYVHTMIFDENASRTALL